MKKIYSLLLLESLIFSACSSNKESKEVPESEGISVSAANGNIKPSDLSTLSKSLTFHASFDKGADAYFPLGDPRIYSSKKVAGQQKPVSSEPGLGKPALAIVPGHGKFGAILEFTLENSHVVLYKAENIGLCDAWTFGELTGDLI